MAYPDREWLMQELVSFCQSMASMVTLDKHGLPTGRTLGARLQPDMTITIATFKTFKRLSQVRANPFVLFIWTKAPDEGQQIAKVVFGKGVAEVISGQAVGDWYAKQGARATMTPDQAVEQLDLIRVRMKEFRAEGFAKPGTELTREEIRSGYTIRV